MPLGSWPDQVDDDFTGTSGTPIDKAFVDSIRESIENSVFSSSNPTRSPRNTTDEVVDARGAFSTLENRLDDLQGLVGSGNAASSTLAASDNVAKNPDLAGWKNGSALAPDHFTLSGAGATVARATGMGSGPFSARVTYVGAAALLTQDLIPTAEWSAQSSLGAEGRKVSLTAKVIASTAAQARVVISDGVTTTLSAFHTGSGLKENLTVTHTISGSATKLSFYFEVAQVGSADFSGIVATFADSPSPGWQPPPRYGHRVLALDITQVGTIGAGTDDLMVYKLFPGLFRANGVTVHVVGGGVFGHNSNSKTLRFQFGSSVIVLQSGTTSTDDLKWGFDAYITRLSEDSQKGTFIAGVADRGTPLTSTFFEEDSVEITMKFTGTGVADNDVIQFFMMIEVIEPSAGI
jgi:hypothetical protein